MSEPATQAEILPDIAIDLYLAGDFAHPGKADAGIAPEQVPVCAPNDTFR